MTRPRPSPSRSFAYLGSPYSHPEPSVREVRFKLALQATAELLHQRCWVYSPIVHCHQLALEHQLPFEFEFWRDYNFAMLAHAETMLVLALDGWRQSKGLQAEIGFCQLQGKQIQLARLDGGQLELWPWSDLVPLP